MEMSPFAYNETHAYEYYPLTKEEVLKFGCTWKDDQQKTQYQGEVAEASDEIVDTDDNIVSGILQCEVTEKNYRILKPELEFYRKMNLPIPRICPDQRHKRRMQLRNPRKLHQRNCDKCSAEIQTSFAPERPEQVYCEQCYLAVVE